MWSMKRISIGFALAFVAIAALIVGCGDDDDDATATSTSTAEMSATPVQVNLTEWSIEADPDSVGSGEVQFFAENTGAVVHELIVAKTDLAADELPTYGESDTPEEGHAVGDVNEDEIDALGEVEDIDPGDTKDVTFNLAPGHYVLYCNIAGHYAQGMHVEFTVE